MTEHCSSISNPVGSQTHFQHLTLLIHCIMVLEFLQHQEASSLISLMHHDSTNYTALMSLELRVTWHELQLSTCRHEHASPFIGVSSSLPPKNSTLPPRTPTVYFCPQHKKKEIQANTGPKHQCPSDAERAHY